MGHGSWANIPRPLFHARHEAKNRLKINLHTYKLKHHENEHYHQQREQQRGSRHM